MTFAHSGKLGDIVYSLPALKACRRASLFLKVEPRLGFSTSHAAQLLPLLRSQSYIEDARIWQGEAVDHELDAFRSLDVSPETNLADRHLRLLGLSSHWRNEPWLEAVSMQGQRVVFARSLAHRGVPGFWQTCYEALGRQVVFVGTSEEHGAFCRDVGDIRFLPTRDILGLAEVIQGASLFVGNQSCPFAIAEGLKRPVIQETYGVANCLFFRPDALQVRSSEDLTLIETFAERYLREGAATASG